MAERTITINKWLGLNAGYAGDTQLKIGEFSSMQNFRIANGYKPEKRYGYESILTTPLGTPVNGQWYGKLNNEYFHLAASAGKLYRIHDLVSVEIGSLTLFKSANATADKYISSATGAEVSSAGNYASEYLPATYDQYTISGHTYTQSAGTIGIAWYDSSKTFISGTSYGGATGNGTYDRPVTAAWYRYTVNTADLSKSMLIQSNAKVHFFQFGSSVYILDGSKFMSFNGTETIDATNLFFNSVSYSSTYPYTGTLTAGKYQIELAGGCGKDFVTIYGTGYGGHGGRIKFNLTLASSATVSIAKVTNGVDNYGESYWISIDSVLYAAVGAGGDGNANYNSTVSRYVTFYSGGDGGGINGEDSDVNNNTHGKGAMSGTGGLGGLDYYGTGTVGQNGYDYNDATHPGRGGVSGDGTTGIGGCGYAGGGGGAYEYPTWGVRRGGGGGGSSYVKSTGITLLENLQGVNATSAYIKISPIFVNGQAVEVAGYTPVTYTSCTPTLTSKTALETINILNSNRTVEYNGDASSTVFNLPETSVYSVNSVYVGGVLKTVTTHYTVDTSAGTVTFTGGNTPASGTNNVVITYTKSSTNDRTEVTKQNFSRLFGGENDNRVFLYGNNNRLIYSDLADGIPSAEYFPVTNTIDIGTTQYDVTGLELNYDRMVINTEGASWWTQYNYDTTLMMANFPIYPLNDKVGQSIKGVEQVCKNYPYVIFNNQLYYFYSSNVRDERNAILLSSNVEPLLNALDMTNATTIDYEKEHEYWIVVGREVYIYNYEREAWYCYYLADSVTTICVVDDYPAFTTSTGAFYQFNKDCNFDNATYIDSHAETGWMNYSLSNYFKFMTMMWAQVDQTEKSDVDIYVITDDGTHKDVGSISVRFPDFSDWDFSDFSFDTNNSPEEYRFKAKAKKFVSLKLRFENSYEHGVTILSATLPVVIGGYSK